MTNLDNKRVFPRDVQETQLQRQDFKCWVDGLPLAMNEAEGGHIVSHIQGGKTDAENFRMMRRIHNRKMGKQNASAIHRLPPYSKSPKLDKLVICAIIVL